MSVLGAATPETSTGSGGRRFERTSGLRKWAHALHIELAPKEIHAAAVTVTVTVATGVTCEHAAEIGERYLDLFESVDPRREIIGYVATFGTIARTGPAPRPQVPGAAR